MLNLCGVSFWDHLKPAERVAVATAIDLTPDRAQLELKWDDGAQTRVSARALRQNCPCAGCVDEWSGRRTFEPTVIPDDMTVLEVHPIGNYALSFEFADHHSTGIFVWKMLRELSTPPTADLPSP